MASFNEEEIQEEIQEPTHRDPGTEDLSVSSVDKLVTSKSVVRNAIHASKDQYPGSCFHRQGIWNVIVISQAFSHVKEPWALVAKIDWLL